MKVVEGFMSDMSTTSPSSSPIRRLFKFLVFGAFTLLLLLLGIVAFLNWRGQREWTQFRGEWEAKGERFDFTDFIPSAVPDDQNFAATPLLAGLLDYTKVPDQPIRWNNQQSKDRAAAVGAILQQKGSRKKVPPAGLWQTGTFADLVQWQEYLTTNATNAASSAEEAAREVLAVLKGVDAEFAELASVSARPFAVFPLEYKENYRMLLPHLAYLKGMAQTLRLRAIARLVAGRKEEGLQDVILGLRLAEALKTEPTLISQLVRMSMVQLAMQPIWEGVARHDWSEAQLIQLQAALSRVRLLEDYGRTIRAERAFGNAAIDELRTGRMSLASLGYISGEGGNPGGVANAASRFVPSGWYRLNQLTLNRLYQERCLPLVDAEKHRVSVVRTRELDDVPELKKPGLYNLFARLMFPAVSKTATKFANGQALIDLATVACALERFRLAQGGYPAQLELLVPRFIEKIPTDLINGELPKYRRESDGTFVVYSVGWNEVDDGGEPGLTKSGNAVDPNKGDWVWRSPSLK